MPKLRFALIWVVLKSQLLGFGPASCPRLVTCSLSLEIINDLSSRAWELLYHLPTLALLVNDLIEYDFTQKGQHPLQKTNHCPGFASSKRENSYVCACYLARSITSYSPVILWIYFSALSAEHVWLIRLLFVQLLFDCEIIKHYRNCEVPDHVNKCICLFVCFTPGESHSSSYVALVCLCYLFTRRILSDEPWNACKNNNSLN